jgi:hypothetical protein
MITKKFIQYWKILTLIGIFYLIPSFQLIYQVKNENTCRFNYKCLRSLFEIKSFNNILSNIGYVFFGIVHALTIAKKQKNELQKILPDVPLDIFLHYAMSEAMVLEGIFSSLYHLCPNMQNYQFDTTFIIMGAGMIIIDYISKMNPKLAFDFFRVFGFFALLVSLNSLQLNFIFPIPVIMWLVSIFLFVWTTNTIMINALFPDVKFSLGIKHIISKFVYIFKNNKVDMGLLIISNGINITIFTIAYQMRLVFPTIFIGLLVSNVMILISFHIFKEIRSRNKIGKVNWILLLSSSAILGISIYFFSIPTYIKFGTPTESRKYNKPCVLFNYFDYHDIWHFTSAFGIFILLQLSWRLQPDITVLRNSSIREPLTLEFDNNY